MKIGIVIQARMNSRRLPGKVMKKLAVREVLWHVVERCGRSTLQDNVIVATSREKNDDIIYDFCKANDINVFRGELDNVLARYYECAKEYDLDTVVRITADCPLIDPTIIDRCIRLFGEKDLEFCSNIIKRTFPIGLDCEVMSFSALERSYRYATAAYEREHVDEYILHRLDEFKYCNIEAEGEFISDARLTLDEPADFSLLKLIFDIFYKEGDIIDTKDVLVFLRNNPELLKINSSVEHTVVS